MNSDTGAMGVLFFATLTGLGFLWQGWNPAAGYVLGMIAASAAYVWLAGAADGGRDDRGGDRPQEAADAINP